MPTPFDRENMDFSLAARTYAKEHVYPDAFGEGTVVDTSDTLVDYEQGCDLIWLSDDGTTTSIQERFRRPKYAKYREVTATMLNEATGRKGDFFKLHADYYCYGYFDRDNGFEELVIVDVDKLKTGAIEPDEQYFPRKQQRFFCWPFDELLERDYHIYHERNI